MATEQDVQDVIRTLIAEGLGEGEEGMRRIAETILNRGEQRGLTPAQVVRERGQYAGYSNPGPGSVKAFNDPNALSAAQAAWQLAQGPDDPTNGANHYWNPNIVNPSWAGSMQQLGQFGNHAFATDMPNWQRPQPRVAPAPLMASSAVQDSRAVTSPSGGNSALQSALDQMATREGNRVTPMGVDDRLMARANALPPVAPSRTPALQDAARRAALTMNQSYAGQDRAPTSSFNGDPLTAAAGPVVATIPSTGGPATNILPSVRVPAANGIDLARAEQASQRAAAPNSPSVKADDIGSMPSLAAIQATMGKPIGTQDIPELYANVFPTDTVKQMQSTGAKGGGAMGVATLLDTVSPTTGLRTTAPSSLPVNVPMPRSRPTGLPILSASARAPMLTPAMPSVRAPVPRANIPSPPLMAQAQQPLRIVVQGSAPPMIPSGPTAQQMVQFGDWATRTSGDTSVGSQADAAAARASGEGGRTRRY